MADQTLKPSNGTQDAPGAGPWNAYRSDQAGSEGPWTQYGKQSSPVDAAPAEAGFIPTVKRTAGQMMTTAATSADDVVGPNAVTKSLRETGQGIIDRNPAGITSLSDVVDKPWLTVKESLGQFAPQIAAAAAGGAAGAAIGSVVPGVGTAIGGAVGSLLPIFTQEYGGIRQEQIESGKEDKLRALGAAIPATALERVGMGKALKVLKGAPIGAGSILKEAGKGILKEGATEGAQNVIEQVGAFKDPTTSESLGDTGLAAVMGGIGGGIMGGAGGAVDLQRAKAKAELEATANEQGGQNAEAAARSADDLAAEANQPPTMDTIAGESINPVDREAPATFEDLVTPQPEQEPDPYTQWDRDIEAQRAANALAGLPPFADEAIDNRPLSQQMGLDPASGPLSSAAALAVDSGATPVEFLGATGRDLQARQTGPGLGNDSNVIDVQGRVIDDRAISTPRRIGNQGPANERPSNQPSAGLLPLGGPASDDAGRGAGAAGAVPGNARRRDAGASLSSLASNGELGAAPTGQRGNGNAPLTPSNFSGTPSATMGKAGPTAQQGPSFGIKDAFAAIRAKKQAVQPQGATDGNQAPQAEQSISEPAQAGNPAPVGAAAPAVAGAVSAGGRGSQAAGLTNSAKTQNSATPGKDAITAELSKLMSAKRLLWSDIESAIGRPMNMDNAMARVIALKYLKRKASTGQGAVVTPQGEAEVKRRADRIDGALSSGGYVQGGELRSGNGMTLMKLSESELASVPATHIRQPITQAQIQAAATAGKTPEKSKPAVAPEAPTEAPAKPARRGVSAKAAEAQKARADYFTPGNIITSYGGGHDRVVSYSAPDAQGKWSVKVRAVQKQGDSWVDVPREGERTHMTQPDARELKAGPVESVQQPTESTAEPPPANEAANPAKSASTPAPANRNPNWRKNAIQAGRVARELGLEPKGKRLAQIVAEVDARDAQASSAEKKPNALEYLASIKKARQDATVAAKQAPREIVVPAEDKPIGKNEAGNLLYERKDGSVYQMRNGRPDFGGILEPVATTDITAPATQAQPAIETVAKEGAIDSGLNVVPAAKVDTPAQGVLNNAQGRKEQAFQRLKTVRQQVKDGTANRLQLIKAESAHKDAVREVDAARAQIEADANKQGLTTVRAQNSTKSPEGAAVRDSNGGWAPGVRQGTEGRVVRPIDGAPTFSEAGAAAHWAQLEQIKSQTGADVVSLARQQGLLSSTDSKTKSTPVTRAGDIARGLRDQIDNVAANDKRPDMYRKEAKRLRDAAAKMAENSEPRASFSDAADMLDAWAGQVAEKSAPTPAKPEPIAKKESAPATPVPQGREVSREIGVHKEGMSEPRANQVRSELARKNPGVVYTVEEDAALKNGYVVVGRETAPGKKLGVEKIQAAKGRAPVQFSRTQSTKSAYESRIDALFAGEKSGSGTRVLDRSDMMGLLGFPNAPLLLDESHVKENQTSHPEMTTEQWKKVPQWLDNPAVAYEDRGRIVMLAPETVAGYPVRMVIEPSPTASRRGQPESFQLLVTVFAKTTPPHVPNLQSLADGGNLRYLDTKTAPEIWKRAGAKFPRQVSDLRSRTRILTEKQLAGYRRANNLAFSLDGTGGKMSSDSNAQNVSTQMLADQSTAEALNATLVRYGLGQDWSNAYAAVKLPDALSGVRDALQAAFGRDVRPVAPTAAKFDIFNGVYIPGQPNAVYVNVNSNVGFVNVAGHELWHTIKRQRPELIDWYRENSRQFYKDLPAYRDRLNALLQTGEKQYDLSKAEEELEADFMGDSLTDSAFLQQLADASPTKFRALLAQVRMWLAGVANRIKGLGSTKEVTDVKALQGYLKEVLVAFAEGKDIPAAPQGIAPDFSRVWHGSPHKFLQFDSSKIGTGEGAQAYGHGLYLADRKGIATGYKDNLSRGRYEFDGRSMDSLPSVTESPERSIAERFLTATQQEGKTAAQAIQEIKEAGRKQIEITKKHLDEARRLNGQTVDMGAGWGDLRKFTYDDSMIEDSQRGVDYANKFKSLADSLTTESVRQLEGQLYQVDLPDDQIAKMLDWDKPLSEQSQEVREAVSAYVGAMEQHLPSMSRSKYLALNQRVRDADITGAGLYKNSQELLGAQLTSALLREQGIPGIRYLDGGSRGNGAGTSNYVIFPGMEKILTIIDVNGEPVTGAEKTKVLGEQMDLAFSRGTNETMTNNDVVGNTQGGRSADDTTPGALTVTAYTGLSEGSPLVGKNDYNTAKRLDVLWAGSTKEIADQFQDGEIRKLRVSLLSPLVIEDANRMETYGNKSHAQIVDDAFRSVIAGKESWDGVIFKDTVDGVEVGDVYAIFPKNNSVDHAVKVLGSLTYDEDGNAIKTPGFDLNESTAPDSGGAAFSRTATDQTQTEAFRKWFGDSKVVDADGNPLRVYHGSPEQFFTFDKLKQDSTSGASKNAFWFTSDKSATAQFGRNITDAYLSAKSLFEVDAQSLRQYFPDFGTASPAVVVVDGKAKTVDINREVFVDGKDQNVFDLLESNRAQPVMENNTRNRVMDAAKRAGADGVVFKGFYDASDNPSDIYAVFNPTQVKSATGNSGAFDPANPDIRFSRTPAPTAIESSMGAMTVDQEAAYKKVAGVRAVPTLKERAASFKANLGLRAKQALVDQFAPIRDISQAAYMQARMSKGSDGAVDALLMYGKPFLRDGVLDVNAQDGGFAQVLASLKGEHDRFFMWVAAQRAERLKTEGKENLMGDDDISALKTLNTGAMPDGTVRLPLYTRALADLNAFNESALKVAMQSGLIDQAAYDLMKDQPYVPFYRLMGDAEGMTGLKFSSGLLNQKAWKKLKGGTQQLNADLMQNSLLNWSHLYAASARNRAALATMDAAEGLGIAYKVPAETKGAVKVMRDGLSEHWLVEDPYLLEAVSALNYSASPLMKPLSKMKTLLTWGVTVNPTFKIRNLVRDSLSAIAQSDLGYNPAANVAIGWKLTASDSQVYASMLASGGVIKFGTQENADRLRKKVAGLGGVLLDETGWKKLKGQMASMYDAYAELGDRTENVNRAALYDQLVKKGHSHLEASFMARDLMDFSMGGSHPAVRFLTQTVPFLNARLQGLYKLGRAASENPKKFAAVAGAVSLASLALLAAYSDDDDWKKREDWDRDAYWWFKIGGTAYRIPKPFEVGAIGTLAERSAELLFNKEMTNKRFMQRVAFMASQTFSFDPVPQAFKPLLDIYSNKDSFTGRAIESMAEQRMRPQDRYNERTSQVARLLGQLGLPDPGQLLKGDYAGLSPKQIDHLLRGYFSWVGTTTAAVTDFALRPATGRGERPDMRLRDVFIAGNFAESLPNGSSRYVTELYEQSRAAEQAYASYREAVKQGDTEKAAEIQRTEAPKLRNRLAYVHATKQMAEINAMAKRIESSRVMSGAEKRERLTALEQRRDQTARRMAALT